MGDSGGTTMAQGATEWAEVTSWPVRSPAALLVTINDIYSFDPNVTVEFDDFADIVDRNFRQPADGLGFDGSPVAHMWRTMIWPNNFL